MIKMDDGLASLLLFLTEKQQIHFCQYTKVLYNETIN